MFKGQSDATEQLCIHVYTASDQNLSYYSNIIFFSYLGNINPNTNLRTPLSM